MTDIFDRVAMQALGSASTLRARVRSRFEPPLGRAASLAESGPIWAEVDPLASGAATTPPSTPGDARPPERTALEVSETETGTEFEIAEEAVSDPTGDRPRQALSGPQTRTPSAVRAAPPAASTVGEAVPPLAGAEPQPLGAPLPTRSAPSSQNLSAAEPRPGPASAGERERDIAFGLSDGARRDARRLEGARSEGPQPDDPGPDGARPLVVPDQPAPRDHENARTATAISRASTFGVRAPSERGEGPGDPGPPPTPRHAGEEPWAQDRADAPTLPTEAAEIARRPRRYDDPLGVSARARIEGHLSDSARRPGPPNSSSPSAPVEVTIGRLEIRAGAAPPPRPATTFAPHLDLAAYRARRERGL